MTRNHSQMATITDRRRTRHIGHTADKPTPPAEVDGIRLWVLAGPVGLPARAVRKRCNPSQPELEKVDVLQQVPLQQEQQQLVEHILRMQSNRTAAVLVELPQLEEVEPPVWVEPPVVPPPNVHVDYRISNKAE